MLRWGILGSARVAADHVAPALRAQGHDLAVVGSRSRSRAQAFAATQGVRRARPSYEEVLEADDVDCVYVPLPNALHEGWTIAALRAGKHVLCEKPLSTTADGARRMAAAAAANGRTLMEAAWPWFHPRTVAVREMVRSGELGAVRAITGQLGGTVRDPADIRLDPGLGGGALLDVGFYPVAMARWVAGDEPAVVRSVARLAASGVDAGTALTLRFPSGTTAALQAGLDLAPVDDLTVAGSRRTLRLPAAHNPPRTAPAWLERSDGEPVSFTANAYEGMVEAFAAAVAGGRDAPLPVHDAIATAEVLDRARGGGQAA